MSDPVWYCVLDGQSHGPLTSEALQRLAAGGVLRPADLVFDAREQAWVSAGGVSGLTFPGPPAEPPEQRQEEHWFYGVAGRAVGPVRWGELRRLAAAGAVRPTDPVRHWAAGAWGPAADVPGLAFPLPADSSADAGTAPAAAAPPEAGSGGAGTPALLARQPALAVAVGGALAAAAVWAVVLWAVGLVWADAPGWRWLALVFVAPAGGYAGWRARAARVHPGPPVAIAAVGFAGGVVWGVVTLVVGSFAFILAQQVWGTNAAWWVTLIPPSGGLGGLALGVLILGGSRVPEGASLTGQKASKSVSLAGLGVLALAGAAAMSAWTAVALVCNHGGMNEELTFVASLFTAGTGAAVASGELAVRPRLDPRRWARRVVFASLVVLGGWYAVGLPLALLHPAWFPTRDHPPAAAASTPSTGRPAPVPSRVTPPAELADRAFTPAEADGVRAELSRRGLEWTLLWYTHPTGRYEAGTLVLVPSADGRHLTGRVVVLWRGQVTKNAYTTAFAFTATRTAVALRVESDDAPFPVDEPNRLRAEQHLAQALADAQAARIAR